MAAMSVTTMWWLHYPFYGRALTLFPFNPLFVYNISISDGHLTQQDDDNGRSANCLLKIPRLMPGVGLIMDPSTYTHSSRDPNSSRLTSLD